MLTALVGSVLEAALTPHPVDSYLELVDPILTRDDLRGRIVAIERPTSRAVRLTIHPSHRWEGFRPGQYIQLSVVINGVRHTRCYSPANNPISSSDAIELTVTTHPNGLVSHHLYAAAQVGDIVGLSPASGDFTLPRDLPSAAVFISGGSGITPVLSMLRSLLASNYRGAITFLHYAHSPDQVAYRAELADIAAKHPQVQMHTIYTRHDDNTAPHGHFHDDHLATVASRLDDAQVFVCGPTSLRAAVGEHLARRGLSDRLNSEAFVIDAGALPDDPDDVSGTLRFTTANIAAVNDGRTILDQAEAHGLTPASGCRMGICFSCSTPKKSGCTRNVVTGELDASTDTHIQLCISAPVGDVEIDL